MNDILNEGLVMMCIGMGTVLLFLFTLIISMHIMSACVAKLNEWFPVADSGNAKTAPTRTNDDSEVAVAIAAAVSKS